MFCNQCGAENPDHARFCASCGESVGAAERPAPAPSNASGGAAVVVLRPVFIPHLALLGTLPLQIFMAIWGGGFFGGFSTFAIQGMDLPIPGWAPFVFFGALFFCGIPLLVYLVSKKTYAKTEYRFHRDRLDYFEGFFTVEEKTIPLANVTEVHLRKGPLQKRHGLGTIVLSTPATASAHRMSGIRVHDVRDPDDVYRNVKELVERARRADGRRSAA